MIQCYLTRLGITIINFEKNVMVNSVIIRGIRNGKTSRARRKTKIFVISETAYKQRPKGGVIRDRSDEIERIALLVVINSQKNLPKLKNAIIRQN